MYLQRRRFATMIRHKRAKLSQTVRTRVAWSQGYRCNRCKEVLHYTFEIDHIQPLFDGGSNDESNLQALCAQCHRIKSIDERSTNESGLSSVIECPVCKAKISAYFRHTYRQCRQIRQLRESV